MDSAGWFGNWVHTVAPVQLALIHHDDVLTVRSDDLDLKRSTDCKADAWSVSKALASSRRKVGKWLPLKLRRHSALMACGERRTCPFACV